jgi:hypothetical protein
MFSLFVSTDFYILSFGQQLSASDLVKKCVINSGDKDDFSDEESFPELVPLLGADDTLRL